MSNKTKAELEAYVQELQERLARLEAGANTSVNNEASRPAYSHTTPTSTDVEIVYTSHSPGHLEGSQFSLDATIFGEKFTLSRSQFDELVGKYRGWFNSGILAVSSKNAEVAVSKGLPLDKDGGLTSKELMSLGNMSPDQIEKLWNKTKFEGLKQSIVTYYKEQFMNNTPGYRDRARVDVLNRLTNGGFDAEVMSLGSKRVRYHGKDLITDAD